MGQKILVVEDNELNLKLFCDLLRAHGYAAEPVRDGREAVERARAFAPDLIVMDIQMPYISGLELLDQFEPRNMRHLDVHDDEVGGEAARGLDRLAAVAHGLDRIAMGAQQVAEQLQIELVVLDNQDFLSHRSDPRR